MIDQPTVLVLGAGASKDFGFPLAWDLLQRTVTCARDEGFAISHLRGLGISPDDARGFGDALAESRAMSVDAFLGTRADLVDTGKVVMSGALIPSEIPSELYTPSPSWLHWLSDRMSTTRDTWHRNRLAIITFNYDRVVEHFLHSSLMNRYGMTSLAAAELLENTVRIVHVHGQMGRMPDFRQPGEARPFSPALSSEAIRVAASGIKVLHEGSVDDQVVNEARQLIAPAEAVVFLGFGYNPESMARLGLETGLDGKAVFGSTIKMEEPEIRQAIARVGGRLTIERSCETLSDFCRRLPIF